MQLLHKIYLKFIRNEKQRLLIVAGSILILFFSKWIYYFDSLYVTALSYSSGVELWFLSGEVLIVAYNTHYGVLYSHCFYKIP